MSRCEPPEGLRDRDGWHWLSWRGSEARPYRWEAFSVNDILIRRWCGLEFHMENIAERAYSVGYRYLRPVPTPEELDALLDSVGDLLHALHNNGPVDGCADRVRAAMSAPSFKERTDGE